MRERVGGAGNDHHKDEVVEEFDVTHAPVVTYLAVRTWRHPEPLPERAQHGAQSIAGARLFGGTALRCGEQRVRDRAPTLAQIK